MLHRMLLAGALALLALPVHAGVITVDDDGGADFTDLPPAVAAAAAGDTLLVHPGVYTSFLLSAKPLTIVGLASGQVRIYGTSRVVGIAHGDRVVLADLDFGALKLNDSPGLIVLDRVRVFAALPSRFAVDNCADVRTIGLDVDATEYLPYGNSSEIAMTLAGPGRVEVVDGWITGRWGATDAAGENALLAEGGVDLRLAGTSVFGGSGGADSQPCFMGCFCTTWGGDAVMTSAPETSVRITGLKFDKIEGGQSADCLKDGCGVGVDASAPATVQYSRVKISGAAYGFCPTFPPATVSEVVPFEPFLDRLGSGGSSGPLRFRVHGIPGDVVTLHFGRDAVTVPIAGVLVEQLTSEEVAIPLGVIPPWGSPVESNLIHVPDGVPPGTTFFAQARTVRNGAEWRTNSTPIVLR